MVDDIREMIVKYGFHLDKMDRDKLAFRLSLLEEEFEETMDAFDDEDPEELVDGLIDLIVIAIGTLELCKVDTDKAWQEVLTANMSKERGVKPGRENSGGFDMIKPENWQKPNHKGNHGELHEILKS